MKCLGFYHKYLGFVPHSGCKLYPDNEDRQSGMRNKMIDKMVTVLKALVVCAILTAVFYTGTSVGQATSEPQYTLIPETNVGNQPVVRTLVAYVDKPVPVVEYVERIRTVPIELRNFNDLEELTQWLNDAMKVTTVRFQSPDDEIDCDDYALAMQNRALSDGYIVSFEVTGRSEYNMLFNTQLPQSQSLHAINSVIIGNNVYFIEPQTGEVAFAVHLD